MEKEKHKKKNEIVRLLEISGEKRGLLVVSGFFATLSTIMQFVPFLAIYMILRQLLIHASDLSGIDGGLLQSWGLWALVSLLVALVFLYIGMMSSHIAAFRILYGLRVKLSNIWRNCRWDIIQRNPRERSKNIRDQCGKNREFCCAPIARLRQRGDYDRLDACCDVYFRLAARARRDRSANCGICITGYGVYGRRSDVNG